jgi:hypothetical protein
MEQRGRERRIGKGLGSRVRIDGADPGQSVAPIEPAEEAPRLLARWVVRAEHLDQITREGLEFRSGRLRVTGGAPDLGGDQPRRQHRRVAIRKGPATDRHRFVGSGGGVVEALLLHPDPRHDEQRLGGVQVLLAPHPALVGQSVHRQPVGLLQVPAPAEEFGHFGLGSKGVGVIGIEH